MSTRNKADILVRLLQLRQEKKTLTKHLLLLLYCVLFTWSDGYVGVFEHLWWILFSLDCCVILKVLKSGPDVAIHVLDASIFAARHSSTDTGRRRRVIVGQLFSEIRKIQQLNWPREWRSHKSPLSLASASVPQRHTGDWFPPESDAQRSPDKSVNDGENTSFIKVICQQETDNSSHHTPEQATVSDNTAAKTTILMKWWRDPDIQIQIYMWIIIQILMLKLPAGLRACSAGSSADCGLSPPRFAPSRRAEGSRRWFYSGPSDHWWCRTWTAPDPCPCRQEQLLQHPLSTEISLTPCVEH